DLRCDINIALRWSFWERAEMVTGDGLRGMGRMLGRMGIMRRMGSMRVCGNTPKATLTLPLPNLGKGTQCQLQPGWKTALRGPPRGGTRPTTDCAKAPRANRRLSSCPFGAKNSEICCAI